MNSFQKIITVCFFILLYGCNSNNETSIYLEAEQSDKVLYNKGFQALNNGEFEVANEYFTQLDVLHPSSKWAIKGQLMSGFSLYKQNKYEEAIFALNKFINLNPNHKSLAYAYYLKGFSYYERIPQVSRDQILSQKAKESFEELQNKFPESTYAKKSNQHLKLLNNQIAGHEMMVGKFYQKQKKYIAAVLRYKTILKKHKNSAQIPESIFRIIECYLSLGLKSESLKLTSLLYYNFPKTSWYKEAYNLMKEVNLNVNILEKLEKEKKINLKKTSFDELNF